MPGSEAVDTLEPCKLDYRVVRGSEHHTCVLQVLHVMGNELACLPEDLMRSTSLHELNAADNQLADVPGDWSAMQALASLVLYGNALRDVPANIASLPSMAALWIEGNPLTVRSCAARVLLDVAAQARLHCKACFVTRPHTADRSTPAGRLSGEALGRCGGQRTAPAPWCHTCAACRHAAAAARGSHARH